MTTRNPIPHCRSATLVRLGRLSLILVAFAVFLPGSAPAQTARRILSDNGDPILYPSYLTLYDGKLFFRANNLSGGNNVELWAYDGKVARLVADINPGPSGSDPTDLAVCNGRLYFCATSSGGASKLWQYDPATGASLAPGSGSQASLPQALFAYGGNLYFRASRWSDIGIELWKFDGVSQTPINLYPGTGSSFPQHFIEYHRFLYFSANGTPGQGAELWRYNGTGMPAEAARLYPNNGSSPENFAVFNGQLYFSAYDGVHGRELWRYDGTNASLAADIWPRGQYVSSNPSGLTVYQGKLYFSANDGLHGCELWSFDGTNAQMVAEINPTPDPGNGDTFMMDSSPAGFTEFEGALYFSANDGVHGVELWSYDGTTPRLVLDLNPGPYGSQVSELTVYNGALYFSGDDGYVPGLNALEPKVFALAPAPPAGLRLSAAQVRGSEGLQLSVGNADGSPVTSSQLAKIQVHTSLQVTNAIAAWQPVTNSMSLSDGAIQVNGLSVSNLARRFFRALQRP